MANHESSTVVACADNPNPNAHIGFVVYYPFHYYVYKSVYEELKNHAEFIVDLGAFARSEQSPRLLPTVVALLQAHHCHYRILRLDDYRYPQYIDSFLSQYDTLVSTWIRGCIRTRSADSKKLVHMTYGAGKELTTFNLNKYKFDLILAYGKYDHNFYSQLTQSVIVGNPKFDEWFSNSVDMSTTHTIQARLDPKKKTLLYLPTHSDLSSIRELAPELRKLTDTYNIIVKVHYYSPEEEPETVACVKVPEIVVVQDDTDLLPLLKLADVVVTDNSSAVFDAMLADKPVIVTDFQDSEYFDTTHQEIRTYPRGHAFGLTYSNSIEQKIKRDGTVDTIRSPHELRGAISTILHDDTKKDARRRFVDTIYEYRDAYSGKRAANAIVTHSRISPPIRPFLNYAVRALLQKNERVQLNNELNQKLEEYNAKFSQQVRETEPGVVFSIIIICAPHMTEDAVLRSLEEQAFQGSHYEIFVVGREKPKIPHSHIRYIHEETLGSSILRAAQLAIGRIVCFVSTKNHMDSDWLARCYLAYERHPNAGGVGGYERIQRVRWSTWNMYAYWNIARQLGIEREYHSIRHVYQVCNSTYYHNPAGFYGLMSYRKDVLTNVLSDREIAIITHPRVLETYLKISVMKSHQICFIPSKTKRLLRTSFRDVFDEARATGYANRLYREKINQRWRYRPYSLSRALAESFAASRQWGMLAGVTIFLGECASWAGTLAAARILFVVRLHATAKALRE